MCSSGNHILASLVSLAAAVTVAGCGAIRPWADPADTLALSVAQPQPCRVAEGSSGRTVVIGHLLQGAGDVSLGAMLIEGGAIIELGDVDEIERNAAGATVFDCRGWYVSPGFVNAHEHLAASGGFPDPAMEPVYAHREQWQGRAGEGHYVIEFERVEEDVRKFWIELRHLFGGATTLGGSGAVAGLLKNASHLDEVGYAYRADTQIFPYPNATTSFEQFACPFGGSAPMDPEFSDDAPTNIPFVPHIAEGINCTAALEGQFYLDFVEANPGRRYAIVHGLGLHRDDIERLNALDVTLVWSPRSNVALYNATVDVPRALGTGARIALGTDWSYSGSYNMLEEMRCADQIDNDAWNDQLKGPDYWRMATAEGAYAMSLEDVTGRLAPGLAADLIVFRRQTGNPFSDLLNSRTSDIAATFVDGSLVTGYGPAFESTRLPAHCNNRIGQHFVCTDYSEYSFDHDELLSANAGAVPLFSTERQARCGAHK